MTRLEYTFKNDTLFKAETEEELKPSPTLSFRMDVEVSANPQI